MVEGVSLRVGIDARPAAAGAASFKRSAEEIIRSAENMGRAVGKVGGGFDKLKKAANDNSRTLAKTAQSLRDVETAVNSLSSSTGQIRSLGEAVKDLGGAADDASRSFGDKFGKEIRGLTDFIIEFGVGLGVSVETMSKIVTAVEGVITIFGAIRFAGVIRDVGFLAALFGRFAPAVAGAAIAVGGFIAATVGLPAAIAVALAAVATGYLLLRDSVDPATTATRKYKKAVEEANVVLRIAAEQQRNLTTAEQEGAKAKIGGAVSEIDAKIDSLSEKRKRREKFIKRLEEEEKTRKLPKDDSDTRIRELKKGLATLNNLLKDQEAAKAKLFDLSRQIEEAGNKPLPIKSDSSLPMEPGGSPEDTGTAAKHDDQRRAAEELERSFAVLQERLDPLGAATRAFGTDLDLLKTAEEAGLITEARQLELRGKLETATLDARDPGCGV